MTQGGIFFRPGVCHITTVTLCGFGAIFQTGGITVGDIVCEAVAQGGIFFRPGICHITAVTFCGFGTVFQTGGITVGDIVCEAVAQGRALVCPGIGMVTAGAIAQGRFGSVFGAGCIVMADIICIDMGMDIIVDGGICQLCIAAADRNGAPFFCI